VRPRLIGLGLLAGFAVVLLRTAWLADDAYITFRVVDNFVEGYGLRWNVAERVQAATHPLWLLLLCALSLITREVYFTSLGLSILLSVGAVWLATQRGASNLQAGLFGVVVLTCSRAFVEYSTSGLESCLTHLLLALFALRFLRQDDAERRLLVLAAIAGLAAFNRLDTVLFFVPALGWELYRRGPRGLRSVVAGFLPLALWLLFATFYYGFPLPNTAPAKLGAGIGGGELAAQGLRYLVNSVRWDAITPLAIAGGLASVVVRRSPQRTCLAAGASLYLLYIVKIGGDFMSGRLLTAPLLVAVVLIVSSEARKALWGVATAAAIGIALLSPAPPFMSGGDYGLARSPEAVDAHGIADERAFQYPHTGLLRDGTGIAPTGELARRGRDARARGDLLAVAGAIGFFGYLAGPEVHVVDTHALADPLLARMPAIRSDPYYAAFLATFRESREAPGWRIGHYRRALPTGYLACLLGDDGGFEDASLRRFVQKLSVVTRGPLFGSGRLLEIVRFNLGRNRGLLGNAEPADTTSAAWGEVIARRPGSAAAHRVRGSARLLANDVEGARGDLTRALALEPRDTDAAVALGALYEDEGRIEESLRLFRRAVEIQPDNAAAHAALALAHARTGEAERVLEHSERALALAPNGAQAWLAKGLGLAMTGSLEEAIDAFETAVHIRPYYPGAYYNLARAHRLNGDGEDERRYLQRAADQGFEAARRALAAD
jgi:arabinofuranosyltransferase